MTSPLQSSHSKLDRAERHLRALKQDVGLFLNRNPPVITHEQSADGHKHLFKIEKKPVIPEVEWGLLIGDCVHNARSALDHLICGIEEWLTKRPCKRFSQFPVSTTVDAFEASRTQDRIKYLPLAARTLIKQAQPFYSGHRAAKHDPLWFLHELDNRDKHRRISLAVAAMDLRVVDSQSRPVAELPKGMEVHAGRFEEGATIAVLPAENASSEMEVQVFVKDDIVFAESPIEGDSRENILVVPMLEAGLRRVRAIIEQFEKAHPWEAPPTN